MDVGVQVYGLTRSASRTGSSAIAGAQLLDCADRSRAGLRSMLEEDLQLLASPAGMMYPTKPVEGEHKDGAKGP